jgi:ElaB/YqjD/DUF883 family membrane-anchored ribosome-binding protein
MGRKNLFAAQVDQAHTAFHADLRKLEVSVRPSSTASLEDVRDELRSARTHTSEHFRLEEQSEWMDTVRKRGPNPERTVEHLRQEHRELLEALDTLIEVVQSADRRDDVIREKIHKWVERVRRHETRKDDLIQEAYTLDLGAAD